MARVLDGFSDGDTVHTAFVMITDVGADGRVDVTAVVREGTVASVERGLVARPDGEVRKVFDTVDKPFHTAAEAHAYCAGELRRAAATIMGEVARHERAAAREAVPS